MKKSEFQMIAKRLQAAYPRAELFKNKDQTKVWYDGIGRYDYGVVMRAATRYINNEKYAPSVAELRGYVKRMYEQEQAYKVKIHECFSRTASVYPAFALEDRAKCEKAFIERVMIEYDLRASCGRARQLEQVMTAIAEKIDGGEIEYKPFTEVVWGVSM